MESNQFGSQEPNAGTDAKACAQYEAMLADVVDGLLTPEDLATFEEHTSGCVSCGVHLADAQSGAAFMSMLKAYPPEPDGSLVTRILAATSVRAAAEQEEALRERQRAHAEHSSLLGGSLRAPVAGAVAVPQSGAGVLSFRTWVGLRLRPISHTMFQPRFMLTAAMAFFSIALTLNVTGIRLNELRASDLKPSSLRRNFYQANAHVVRYYDNLRVVYELESRVHDLQHGAEDNGAPASYPGAANAPKQKDDSPGGAAPKANDPGNKSTDGGADRPAPNPKSGSSRREYPAPHMLEAAYGGRSAWPIASALEGAGAWDTPNEFGRAL